MDIDLELYHREVRISSQPLVGLSVSTLSPPFFAYLNSQS
jgi:hypothetical protein